MNLRDVTNRKEFIRKERVRIANMVKRKPEIQKKCCICGRLNADILHNDKNPYMITFLCDRCRKNKEKIQEAEKYRFDLREVADKSKLSSKNFTIKDLTQIVDDFITANVSIGNYCDSVKISRYQLNNLVARYVEHYGNEYVKSRIEEVTSKSNKKYLNKFIFLQE